MYVYVYVHVYVYAYEYVYMNRCIYSVKNRDKLQCRRPVKIGSVL